jgi:glutaryl-CoA dehydrogenase
MSQLAEKVEQREAKGVQIKDAAFKWDDPLDLEGELTEEERMVRDLCPGQIVCARARRQSRR